MKMVIPKHRQTTASVLVFNNSVSVKNNGSLEDINFITLMPFLGELFHHNEGSPNSLNFSGYLFFSKLNNFLKKKK
jgi:hypothetical protein